MATKLLQGPSLIVPVAIASVAEIPDVKFKGHWKSEWYSDKDNSFLELKGYCPGPFTMKIKTYSNGIELLLGCSRCQLTSRFSPEEEARVKLDQFKINLSKCIFNAALSPKKSGLDYFESDFVVDSHKKRVFCLSTGVYYLSEQRVPAYTMDYPVFLAFIPSPGLKEAGLEAAHFLFQEIKGVSMELEKQMKERLK